MQSRSTWVRRFLEQDHAANTRLIASLMGVSADQVPTDAAATVDFGLGRCQPSSMVLLLQLLDAWSGLRDDASGRFVVSAPGREGAVWSFLDFCQYGQNEHAFLKLTPVDAPNDGLILDPTYRQFVGQLHPDRHEQGAPHFAESARNRALLREPATFVGTADEIRRLMQVRLPETGRTRADSWRIPGMWHGGIRQDDAFQHIYAVLTGRRSDQPADRSVLDFARRHRTEFGR